MGATTATPAKRVRIDDAYIDVLLASGATIHLQLIDVSRTGVGFKFPGDVNRFALGSELNCVLGLRGHEIPGRMTIVRTKPSAEQCGATFRAGITHRERFRSTLASIE